jgi:hypothetical protein
MEHTAFIEERQRRQRQREIEDMKWIISKPQGRRFLWGLLMYCHTEEETEFRGNSHDIFEKGKRIVGMKTRRDIVDAGGYAILETMFREYNSLLETEKAIEERHKRGEI